ncbi:unnamed protein product [Symbiodinium necroappetens]|uniref:VTT domain-containing protein n=1 Tax=Symbiodinium necroappetens TaxID=1628268 RepID=A0A812QML7_9DINO|nr:unnamed protein product [Symbiodinium necroappetens]
MRGRPAKRAFRSAGLCSLCMLFVAVATPSWAWLGRHEEEERPKLPVMDVDLVELEVPANAAPVSFQMSKLYIPIIPEVATFLNQSDLEWSYRDENPLTGRPRFHVYVLGQPFRIKNKTVQGIHTVIELPDQVSTASCKVAAINAEAELGSEQHIGPFRAVLLVCQAFVHGLADAVLGDFPGLPDGCFAFRMVEESCEISLRSNDALGRSGQVSVSPCQGRQNGAFVAKQAPGGFLSGFQFLRDSESSAGFRSWTSFQNSYELVGIGEENDRRCLHNHMLHQMEAKKSNRFVCDFCRRKIVQGELFWSCERCVWDVCQACYAKGARFKAGSEIELIQPFHHYRRHTSGIIQEVIDDSEGRHQQLLVTLRHEDSPSEERLQREDFSKIRVIEKSQLNVRLVVGVCLIVAFFLYGILDHHRLSRLISRLVHWCRTIGMWSALILFLVSSVLPVIMLPVFPVMALSGPLFTKLNDGEAVTGGAIAFGVVFSGLWVGSVLAFALGKTLLNDYARKASKHSRVLRRLNRVKIVFMARSLPILPAEVFDYACAMTTLAVHEYAIGCLGSAVPVAFWTFSTAQASDLTSPKRSQATHLALIIINVGCLALLTVLLVGVIQKHEQEHAEEDETIQIAWNTGWKDPKTEILQVLRFHQLDPHKEGRDFTIRDCNNKLLQLGGVLSIGSFLIRKWDRIFK